MAKPTYNIAEAARKLKQNARTHFLAGSSCKVVSQLFKLSESLVQEWHDEFVLELLQGGHSKRVFMRELLMRNSPQMILTLVELAKQNGDEALKKSAAQAVLAFSARFFAEDARILNAESKARQATADDRGLQRGLFDIRDPDVEGAAGAKMTVEDRQAYDYSAEIAAAMEALIAAEEAKRAASEPEAAPNPTDVASDNSAEAEAYYSSGVELFDGIDD